MSDEELVRRVRAGDRDAARQLYQRYEERLRTLGRRRLFGKVRRKVGDSDLVQETYAAAFEALDRFVDQGAGSFRRWLDAILDHKAKDVVKGFVRVARRSVEREDSVGPDGVGGQAKDGEVTPSALVAGREERDALQKAIEATTGDDRWILSLVHEHGLGFAEAGRLMGRSAEAARKLYGRAILRITRARRQGGEGTRV